MQNENPFIKKRKFPSILFVTICFIGAFVAGILGLTLSDEEISLSGRLIAGAFCLVFLIGVIWGGSELAFSKRGITLSKDGLTDRSTRMACGFIPWSNVKDIQIDAYKGHCYATFLLHDPRQAINQSPGPVARLANTLHHAFFGSPVRLNMQDYEAKVDDLLSILDSVYIRNDGPEVS